MRTSRSDSLSHALLFNARFIILLRNCNDFDLHLDEVGRLLGLLAGRSTALQQNFRICLHQQPISPHSISNR